MRKALITLLTIGTLLAPRIASSLDGIVYDPLTREGVHNEKVISIQENEEGRRIHIDSTYTDGDGCFNLNLESVILKKPNYRIPNDIEWANLHDFRGAKISKLNLNELTRQIPTRFDLPSGTYFLRANNSATVQFQTMGRSNITFDPFPSLVDKRK